MLVVAVVDEVDVFANVLWLVMVAVKPVTFLQPDPTELFVPATKRTVAHYDEYKSAQTLSTWWRKSSGSVPGTIPHPRHLAEPATDHSDLRIPLAP